MNRFLKSVTALACGLSLSALNASAQGWPSEYEGVMLQGFYWDSYDASQWTKLESEEIGRAHV